MPIQFINHNTILHAYVYRDPVQPPIKPNYFAYQQRQASSSSAP